MKYVMLVITIVNLLLWNVFGVIFPGNTGGASDPAGYELSGQGAAGGEQSVSPLEEAENAGEQPASGPLEDATADEIEGDSHIIDEGNGELTIVLGEGEASVGY